MYAACILLNLKSLLVVIAQMPQISQRYYILCSIFFYTLFQFSIVYNYCISVLPTIANIYIYIEALFMLYLLFNYICYLINKFYLLVMVETCTKFYFLCLFVLLIFSLRAILSLLQVGQLSDYDITRLLKHN